MQKKQNTEVNVRKNGSYSAKQLAAKKLDDEMADLLKQIDELEGGLSRYKTTQKILALQREISFRPVSSRMHDALDCLHVRIIVFLFFAR